MIAQFLVLIALISNAHDSASPGVEKLLAIEPDPKIQARLEEVTDTLRDGNVPTRQRFAALGTLADLATEDEEHFFEQLFYFYCRHQGRGNVNEGKRFYTIWLRMLLGVSDPTVVKTVLPYIESDNERLRSIVRSFLGLVEGNCPGEPCGRDYSHYEAFLRRDDPPQGLVKYMYQESPASALLTLRGVYAKDPHAFRDVLWAEHVISDALWKKRKRFIEEKAVPEEALTELEKLAQHEEWWARLYAAEILNRHPEFRTEEMVESLKRDENELVREAITREKRKPPKPQPRPEGTPPEIVPEPS